MLTQHFSVKSPTTSACSMQRLLLISKHATCVLGTLGECRALAAIWKHAKPSQIHQLPAQLGPLLVAPRCIAKPILIPEVTAWLATCKLNPSQVARSSRSKAMTAHISFTRLLPFSLLNPICNAVSKTNVPGSVKPWCAWILLVHDR